MDLDIIGGSYWGRSSDLNAQRCINFYPVIDQQEGAKARALIGTPACVEWCDLSASVEIRNMITMGSSAYAVGGNTLYSITSAGVETAVAGTIGTSTGSVYVDHDGTNLVVVDPDLEGYVYTVAGGTLTAIADGDFPTPGSMCVIDGYCIVNSKDTDQFFISTSGDPTAWDALDYASVESAPGILKRVGRLNRQLMCLKEHNTEVWYNSGAAAFPFERIQGVYIDYGIVAPDSYAAINNTAFWLNQFRQFVAYDGSSRIVSTEQIEYRWGTYSTVSNAKAYPYTQEGHTFIALIFPNENTTWFYDLTTGFWHERQSYPEVDGEYSRHRGNCYTRFADKNLIGDYANGKIYYYDLGAYLDNAAYAIRRMRTTQAVQQDQAPIFFHQLQLIMETGVGLISGQGSEPRVVLQYSDDGGYTWSSEVWGDMGMMGKYATRVLWRRLGKSRNRIFRFVITDPVRCVLLGASLHAELGAN